MIVILGMGQTGMTCLHFLAARSDQQLHIMDSRSQAPATAWQELQEHYPTVTTSLGGFDLEVLSSAEEIVISPGIDPRHPNIAAARAQNIPIVSEIEIFSRYINAPVVGITGSNGKSTVTTLLGEMAKHAGWQVRVGGNLGTSALELLSDPAPDLYILELSSFQLEATESLQLQAATVLNISEDHLDRYEGMDDYAQTKQRIFLHAQQHILNLDDARVIAMKGEQATTFSLQSSTADFYLAHQNDGQRYFMQAGQTLFAVDELHLQNSVMYSNTLAALALGMAVGMPLEAMRQAAAEFTGLPHRCQHIREWQDVDWFNDSKGTNVGAAVSAVEGLERAGHIILLAGGEGKDADFSPLAEVAKQHLKAAIVFGRDAPLIADVLEQAVSVHRVENLEQAVQCASQLAEAGDAVLLSPACASFDQFRSYVQRGERFEELVQALQ